MIQFVIFAYPSSNAFLLDILSTNDNAIQISECLLEVNTSFPNLRAVGTEHLALCAIQISDNKKNSATTWFSSPCHMQPSSQAVPASQLYTKLKLVGKGAYGSVYKGYVHIPFRSAFTVFHIVTMFAVLTISQGR